MRTIQILRSLILLIAVTACSVQRDPSQVVETMYNALQEGDTDSYMDTLRPVNRRTPDLTGVLATVMGGLGISAGPVSLDLGGLLQPSFQGMNYTTVGNDGHHALVQARGKIRMMMMEFPFCDTHDVVNEDGSWYVDNYHPDRPMRVQAFSARNQQQLLAQNPDTAANVDPLQDIAQALATMGPAMEVILNFCQ